MMPTCCAQRSLERPARSGSVDQSPERLENFRQPSDIKPRNIGTIDGRNCAADRIMKLHDRKLGRSKLARENLGSPLICDITKNRLWIHCRRRSFAGFARHRLALKKPL